MEPVSDERLNAAHQRVLNQMKRRSRASREPAEHEARQHPHPPGTSRPKPASTRKTPPHTNHHTLDGQGADPHPSRDQVPDSHNHYPSRQGEGPTTEEGEEEEAGCWGWSILLPVARAVLAMAWTITYCALVKPLCRATKCAFLILAVLGFIALIAAWVINVSLGGLHALHVWACDDILPNRLFFVDWCASINTDSPHRPAASTTASEGSSSVWTPLTPAESSLLQKPDRHFCVFGFGDLLGGMADEQRKYMTEQQRESFAVMRRAGSVVGQLQDIGRKQARTVVRAQEKMMGLIDDPATLPPLPSRRPPPPPPPPAWFGAVWFWGLFADKHHPPPVTPEGLFRDISRVLDGEVTSRKQFVKDVTALSQEMGQVASSVCGWNTALGESISDKTRRLGEARRRSRPTTSWWQQVTKGATGELMFWEDQAKVIRNEIIKWRRRKAKANLVCKMLTEGASKTAKLLKAIQDEETHLGEMAQGAADLVAEVSSQGGQASDDVLQRWSATARDLGVNYLQSFRLYYSKC